MAARFPEVPRGQFETAVQLVEPDGHVYGGAEAVFRALAQKPHEGWLLDWYEHSPVFAHATEWGYRLVARNRRVLLGPDAPGLGPNLTRRRTTWCGGSSCGRWAHLPDGFRVLWVQIIGLVGTDGILPAKPAMDRHAPGRRRATPRPGSLPPGADAVLVQSDRWLPEVSMRSRDGAGDPPRHRLCPRPVPVPAVADLPFAGDGLPRVSQFPVGHPAVGNRLPGDLPGTLAILAPLVPRGAALTAGGLAATVAALSPQGPMARARNYKCAHHQ